MQGQLPERLSAILADVHRTIVNSESGVAVSARDLSDLVDELERERSAVGGELEQISLDRMVQETAGDGVSAETADKEDQLRASHREMTAAVGRVSTLLQRVVDFEHLMTSARQQFSTSEDLPGVEDAQALNQRQAMIRAKEDERKRLSREIHDGPAQVLANAIIGLEFIERSLKQAEATAESPAVSEVERIKSSMREGLSEIRRFIFDLRPTMLAQRGLIGTVEHYINTYRTFLPDETNLDLSLSSPKLSPEQELTAFRVIQESLQNVHRHSDATRCTISIGVTDDRLEVDINDNGRGFDPSAVKVRERGGSGIIGMRERAEVIGATLDIESSSGNGCRIRLIIPTSMRVGDESRGDVVDQRRSHQS